MDRSTPGSGKQVRYRVPLLFQFVLGIIDQALAKLVNVQLLNDAVSAVCTDHRI
jgi:hypothetical protein